MITLVLVAVAALWLRGVVVLSRRQSSQGHLRERVAFSVGWISLATALLSPLDRWADASFSAHMVQHELLMVVAAPLLVIARPLATMLWGLPDGARHWAGSILQRPSLRRGWTAVTTPAIACGILLPVTWLWHAPLLFDTAVEREPVHWAQHLSFFSASGIFWWSVLRVRGRIGVSLLSLFITAVQSSVLGALLSFARIPWYAHYERLAGVGRALDDQRLAGLIMWVPGSVPYLIAALWIVRRSLLPNRRSGESSESHRFWRLTTAPRAP